MINLSMWEIILGIVTLMSFCVNVLQYFRKRLLHNHAIGIYSQLWNIVYEIDKGRVKDLVAAKILLNQVRIETIALNHNIGRKEKVLEPWDFGRLARYNLFREDIDWKIEKSKYVKKLSEVQKEGNILMRQIEAVDKELQKAKEERND